MITIDFETEAIEGRPTYPPKPVGVAIKYGSQPAEYLAWGHPSGNNSTIAKAKAALKKAWDSGADLLFHNAKFDMDVAETHFKLPRLSWRRIHDTMFLLFLKDPHSNTISLKPAAERYLGQKPEEQDAVAAWLRAHGVITAAQRPGAFISQAPGDVVGPYACGDVDRTWALFDLLHPQITSSGVSAAYDRERRLMPILLDNERQGIRVDTERLGEDLFKYEGSLVLAEGWLRNALKTPSLNLDADGEVADALQKVGAVKEWKLTPTGRRSTSKKNLIISHKPIAQALDYRNRLQNVLSQSMRPWLIQAKANEGYIFTDWNQVRTNRGGDVNGTRTGRLSCARFMNIAKAFSIATPEFVGRGVLPLPLVRRYLVPDEGQVWLSRDYSSQEFRILAHFENAGLLGAYQADPRIDFHEIMKERILKATGQDLPRKDVKILNFGILYGMGVGRLAEALKIDVEAARGLKDAHRRAAPGVQHLNKEMKRRAQAGEPIRTWGGRVYYCEPPGEDGRSFDYKMINYLVQGSAADCTKEAIIRYADMNRTTSRFVVTVHDEINISAQADMVPQEMEKLRKSMESIEFDVPMLSEGSYGPSWGELKEGEP